MTPRLLAVTEGGARGYARVGKDILPLLRSAFDLVQVHTNRAVGPVEGAWPIEPNRVTGDLHARSQAPDLLARHRPDLVWLHQDWQAWMPWQAAVAAAVPGARGILYSPPPAACASERQLAALSRLSSWVLFTEHSRQEAARAFSDTGIAPPPLAALPHGVDTGLFRPLGSHGEPAARADRTRARAILFGGRDELADAFIVLNANRNVTRKRLDLTVRGFALFAANKPDAWLCLHAGLSDQGWPLAELAAAHGIGGRVLLTADGPQHPSYSEDGLNLLYNCCDVGVNSAEREGFGLVALEHAAAGAAQLVPNLPTQREIWGNAAFYVDVDERHAPRLLAAALAELYDCREKLSSRSAAAYRHAISPRFALPRLASSWAMLFRKVLRGGAAAVPLESEGRLEAEGGRGLAG
jgi:glycosyltransferase involved in cell wall biosynthesis